MLQAKPMRWAWRSSKGDSTQKVSVQIPKNLDYKLAPGEIDAVRDRMAPLNVRMPVYVMPAISEDGQIARKTFEFAKSLGVETLAVERMPASLPAIEKLADEFGVNVALGGSAKAVHEALQGRGRRLGAYADLGKWAQEGIAPLDGIALLNDRVLALKLSDKTALAPLLAELSRRELKPSLITVGTSGATNVMADLSRSLRSLREGGSACAGRARHAALTRHPDQGIRAPDT